MVGLCVFSVLSAIFQLYRGCQIILVKETGVSLQNTDLL
jgi:hypothetical protein